MKTNSTFALVTLGLAAILAPMHVAAQSGNAIVNVPFNFSVGSQVLPAGEYLVSAERDVMRLNSVDGNSHMAAIGFAVETPNGKIKASALVFKQYGDRYFLSQIWSDSARGTELPRSAVEREMSAKNHATAITLLASRR